MLPPIQRLFLESQSFFGGLTDFTRTFDVFREDFRETNLRSPEKLPSIFKLFLGFQGFVGVRRIPPDLLRIFVKQSLERESLTQI